MSRAFRLALAAVVPLVALTVVGFQQLRHSEPKAAQTLEEAIGYSPDRWDALLAAQRRAVSECMRRHGYRYVAQRDAYFSTAPHGLFDLDTLTAEDAYLKRRALGVVAIADALRAQTRRNAGMENQRYADSLGARARQGFTAALRGDGSSPGCATEPPYGLPRAFLPEGGQLGDAYARGWARVKGSAEYRRWVGGVAHCMTDQGVVLPDGDPRSAGRPVLARLIRLAHGHSATDQDGRWHYSIQAAGLTPRVVAALPGLAQAERRIAAIELNCRSRFSGDERDLSRHAAGRLETAYPDQVAYLRLALFAAAKDDMRKESAE